MSGKYLALASVVLNLHTFYSALEKSMKIDFHSEGNAIILKKYKEMEDGQNNLRN